MKFGWPWKKRKVRGMDAQVEEPNERRRVNRDEEEREKAELAKRLADERARLDWLELKADVRFRNRGDK